MHRSPCDSPNLDADEVHPRLWIGSFLLPEKARQHGFDCVVYCAENHRDENYQPEPCLGIECIYAPMSDCDPMRDSDAKLAERTAKRVANRVAEGRCVLVTCRMGINRSALVTALALRRLTGMLGIRCVNRVQRHRLGALDNQAFVKYIVGLDRRR